MSTYKCSGGNNRKKMNCIKSENKKISYTEVGKFLFRRAV